MILQTANILLGLRPMWISGLACSLLVNVVPISFDEINYMRNLNSEKFLFASFPGNYMGSGAIQNLK